MSIRMKESDFFYRASNKFMNKYLMTGESNEGTSETPQTM